MYSIESISRGFSDFFILKNSLRDWGTLAYPTIEKDYIQKRRNELLDLKLFEFLLNF
jgi:hypothetical protein